MNLLCASKAADCLELISNPEWSKIATKMKFIEKDGITMEHSSYKGEPIKQADVNLLTFPLKQVTEKKRVLSELDYYRRRVPEKDTPAMTQAIFSLLYSRYGEADLAWHYFQDAYKPNILPPFGVIAECKGGDNPYFVTGAGGVLQNVLMGFGGLEIDIDGHGIKQVKSVLPKHWRSLKMTNIGPEKKTYTVGCE